MWKPDLTRAAWPTGRVRLLSEGASFEWAVREACRQVGVGCVIPAGLREDLVYLDVGEIEFRRCVELLAEQVDRLAVWDGSVLAFVRVGEAERAYTLLLPGAFDVERVGLFVKEVGGAGVEVTTAGDRVFVSGPVEAIAAVERLGDVLRHGPDSWLVEVRAVEVSEAFSRAMGLAWSVGGRLAVGLGVDDVGLLPGVPVTGAAASALLEVVARAEAQSREAATYAQGMLYVLEGSSATMTRGDRVPIPERRVSDQGNVTVTGYSFIQTGFTVEVTARRVEGGVVLDLAPEISSISGFVEEVPIVAQSRVSASVFVRSGEWLVVSGLESGRRSESLTGLPGLLHVKGLRDSNRVDDHSSVLLFVRATRVRASVSGEVP